MRPFDLINSDFKYAFIPGYPLEVYSDGILSAADNKMFVDIGEIIKLE